MVAAVCPAFVLSNFLVYRIAPARRAMDAEDRDVPGTGYDSDPRMPAGLIPWRIALAFSTLTIVALALPVGAKEPPRDVRKVHIELTEFGLGGSSSESFDLTPSGNDFLLRGAKKENAFLSPKADRSATPPTRVAGDRVRTLAAAFSAPPVSRVDGLAQLASPQWLAAHAAASYDVLASGDGACSDEARKLFTDRYMSDGVTLKATNAYFDSSWFDDYPSATVSVTYTDGATTTFASRSQHAFMLPWKSGAATTWSPALANAIAGVLPDASEYKVRLSAQGLVPDVARTVLKPIQARWEDLEGRCLYKSTIAELAPRFDVASVFHTGPETLSATLRNTAMPRNLLIDVRLPGGDSPAAKAAMQQFFGRVPAYIDVARSFVASHPSITFELWYSEGRSFNFDDDEVYGDDAAADRLRNLPRRDEGVLLREHGKERGREWVVLPDGQSVLWNKAR